jgi:hypothetical protein
MRGSKIIHQTKIKDETNPIETKLTIYQIQTITKDTSANCKHRKERTKYTECFYYNYMFLFSSMCFNISGNQGE